MKRKEPQINIITETKLKMDPNLLLITVKKKPGRYVDELWLKFLKEAEVIESYKMNQTGEEAVIELTLAVEEI